MEIYVFDDKPENVDAANLAIADAGHTPVARREYFKEHLPRHVLGTHLRSAEKFGPSLLNESENMRMSRNRNLMYEIKWSTRLMSEHGGGIITDLMFHIGPHHLECAQPPAGLLVALQAVSVGIPVVICTDLEGGEHHTEAISWIFDGYVSRLGTNPRFPRPFGWVENKDWGKAIQLLAETREKLGAG
tara:strand:+ start:1451 stop:2014 length:564 start_codon:yes stop_codon:yes gene_type:complete